jgi:hypothetical protein
MVEIAEYCVHMPSKLDFIVIDSDVAEIFNAVIDGDYSTKHANCWLKYAENITGSNEQYTISAQLANNGSGLIDPCDGCYTVCRTSKWKKSYRRRKKEARFANMGDDPHTLLKVLRALLPMVVSTIPPKGRQITILLAIYIYLDTIYLSA